MNKYLKQNSIQNDDNLYDALINLNKNKMPDKNYLAFYLIIALIT